MNWFPPLFSRGRRYDELSETPSCKAENLIPGIAWGLIVSRL